MARSQQANGQLTPTAKPAGDTTMFCNGHPTNTMYLYITDAPAGQDRFYLYPQECRYAKIPLGDHRVTIYMWMGDSWSTAQQDWVTVTENEVLAVTYNAPGSSSEAEAESLEKSAAAKGPW